MRALMTQKSCAVGMRMAKLGNHFKGNIVLRAKFIALDFRKAWKIFSGFVN